VITSIDPFENEKKEETGSIFNSFVNNFDRDDDDDDIIIIAWRAAFITSILPAAC